MFSAEAWLVNVVDSAAMVSMEKTHCPCGSEAPGTAGSAEWAWLAARDGSGPASPRAPGTGEVRRLLTKLGFLVRRLLGADGAVVGRWKGEHFSFPNSGERGITENKSLGEGTL